MPAATCSKAPSGLPPGAPPPVRPRRRASALRGNRSRSGPKPPPPSRGAGPRARRAFFYVFRSDLPPALAALEARLECTRVHGPVAAPFTRSRSASTTPVSPSRNRSSSRWPRRRALLLGSPSALRAVARHQIGERAPARVRRARAKVPVVVREPRARLELQPQVLVHARAAHARRASRSDGDDEEHLATNPIRGANRTSSAVSSYSQRHSPRRRTCFAPPRNRSRALRDARRKCRLALFSALSRSSSFVSKHRYASRGDGAKRDVPSPHIHHHVVRGVREERSASSASAPGTSVNAVNVACSSAGAAAVPARRRRAARRAVRVRRDLRRKGVSEEQRTTTSPSRTSLRVEPARARAWT